MNPPQYSQYLKNIYISLEEAFEFCRSSFVQADTKLYHNRLGKHKTEKIYIWNPQATRFIMDTLIYAISMEFQWLRGRHPQWQGVRKLKTAVFAG